MNGSMELKQWYSYERHGGSALKPHWSRAVVDKAIDDAFNDCPNTGNYPGSCIDITAAINAFPIRNQTGIVLGSVSPWLEGILLAHGARHLTTVEYGRIVSDDPRIRTVSPLTMASQLLGGGGGFEKVDFVFTFSTLEHIGLGRYAFQPMSKTTI
jgi:hypothetical protein